ncbi:MAG: cation:proton antiporter [Candidatus Tectomicrobia bacterium]|nr:cation:proton antiporter [Candidatus Tectomicrobia bacterium]
MSIWTYLTDYLVVLAAALLLGVVFERLRQNAILGYLLAGMLLGPRALNLVHGEEVVRGLAELGVALLLFAIGLEFSLRRLLRLGRIGLGGGTLQLLLTGGAAAAVGWAVGMAPTPTIAVAAMVSLSSTACVLRVLLDRAEIDSVHGRGALGILLLQDVAVVPLVLLISILGGATSAAGVPAVVGRALLLIVGLAGAFYLTSTYLLPRLFGTTVLSRNRELLILLAAILALGSAWAAHRLGLSPAVGAFFAGVLLAESPFALQIRADVGALRTLFATLFFASLGMVAHPGWLLEHWRLVAGLAGAIVVGKALLAAGVAVLLRYPLRHAMAMGLCLAQVGEFSFVMAEEAVERGVIADDTFLLFVSVPW